jgi:hypothetical protein
MTGKAGKDGDRRRNRAVPLGEALGGVLGPVLKRRGFASRDIIAHWAAIAPAPYDGATLPERLVWPRGQKGAEGAVLHLRCADGHKLALAHEGPRVAAAVNRYFGYLLVGEVRLSAAPLHRPAAPRPPPPPAPPEAVRRVAAAVARIEDPQLREALRRLGHGIAGRHGPGFTGV